MEFPMQCRLCLSSGPAEAFVSIHGNPQPHLAERISSCCQLQVEINDGLPDTICHYCNNNLELLISFRKVCLQSDKISKLKLNKRVNIKQEEVLLEDLIWEKEFNVRSPPNVYNAPIKDKINEWELSTAAQTDSKPSIHSIGNICSGSVPLSDHNPNEKLTLFECDICFKSFDQTADLEKHKTYHNKEVLYKCLVHGSDLKATN
ncbi:uncharacterized protein LOC143921479 isoform X3 [Arctopsyche grandis]|uniref:uncharacterized protein LOC143921479 isoform X3 n=1 Tax=Arctopsyche grandis TaxID=121162 RepID=UPI00406D9ADB